MRIIELHPAAIGGVLGSRQRLMAIPVNQINSVTSCVGSENTTCYVNNMEMNESYNEVLALLREEPA